MGESPGRPERERTRVAAWSRRAGARLGRFVSQAWDNPIVLKELRARMRGWRAPVVLSVHLGLLSCFAALIYFIVTQSASANTVSGVTASSGIGRTVGQTLFYSTYMLLLTLVVFLAPAFTAGTISGERERQTFDILITTLLPARSLVLGKLVSALAYIVLLILAALPIQGLALMFGGILLSEVLIGTLLLLVTALIAGSIGMFVSSLMKSSIGSTVLTYAAILLGALGLPIVAVMVISFLGSLLDPVLNNLSWVAQAALIYIGGFLICTNPFATAVATKIIEQEENTLFFFTARVTQATATTSVSRTLPLLSPWIVYVALYVVVSALLIGFSILIIERRRG